MIGPAAKGIGRARWVALLAGVPPVLLLLALTRNSLRHVPLYDELLHVLAARGLLQQGVPTIADGLYERALLFTRLVAVATSRFGDTLVAARSPALIGAVLLAFCLSFWIARRAGWFAGVAAGVFLAILPVTIQLSVFARFYTLHALVILVIAIVAYEATGSHLGKWPRAALIASVFPLLALAWHLQESTAIAAGAIVMGAAAVLFFDHWLHVREFLRRRMLLSVAAICVTSALGVAAIFGFGLVERFNTVPLWAAGNAMRPQYYLQALASDLPLLWPLTLCAAICALRTRTRLAIFCVVAFMSGLVVHSIAASKAMRYIYYLMPFLCAMWACALDGAADHIRTATAAHARRLWLTAALTLAFATVASQEGQRTMRLFAGKVLSAEEMGYVGEADWSPLLDVLRDPVAGADRLLTSNSMKALYYLGRYDYEISASIVGETDSGNEFGTDLRTGRTVISTAASVSSVLEMPGTSVVIIEEKKIAVESGVPAAAMEVIESHCVAMTLPPGSAVRAWRCTWP